MDEIITGFLILLQAISDGDVEPEHSTKEAAIQEYESILSTFTDAHWEDDPLAGYWNTSSDFTPDSPKDPIIKAIAKHGERTHVLRELAARYDPRFSLSAYGNPERLNADPDDPDDVAKKFIEEWDRTRESMPRQQFQARVQETERTVGGVADEIVERTWETSERASKIE